MKNKKEKPTIEKFRISQLSNPQNILGGDPGDDDHTITGNEGKKCIMDTAYWVDIGG